MKKLIIDSFTNKIKIVSIVDNEIDKISILDKEKLTIVGNVYVGRVQKIVNKQFCFVQISKDEKCFIDLKDSKEINILAPLHEGAKVLVEIIKEKTHDKVAKATFQVNFWNNGNIHIFKSDKKEIRVSKSIKRKVERERLKTIGDKIYNDYSILFRTNAVELSEDEIQSEYNILVDEANDKIEKARGVMPPFKIYDRAIIKNLLSFNRNLDEVVTNDKNLFDNIFNMSFCNSIMYKDDILVDYGMQLKIDKLFNKKVWLKSGGFIYIEETESAVLIDVNTGKFTKSKNSDKTILKTNIEAIEQSFKEIKLRNLSGIILIDLINIRREEDVDIIVKKIKELCKIHNSKIIFEGISDLFLLELTRKKELGSLSSTNSIPCPYCRGNGKVMDLNFVCDKIFREVYWYGVNTNKTEVVLQANKDLLDAFIEKNKFLVETLEEKFSIKVKFNEILNSSYDYFDIS